MKRKSLLISILGLFLTLAGCTGVPDNVHPVKNFDAQQYLGKWYEIARLDHSFERGMTKVSAEYTLRDDGGIAVTNRGYNAEKQQWKEAHGKAYFVRDNNTGYLKVSFFGPFYGSYIVFDLGDDYQYSMISGPNHDYLWLLARTPTVSDTLKADFVRKAKARGFNTDELIWLDTPPQK